MSGLHLRLGSQVVSVMHRRDIRQVRDHDEARRVVEAATEQLGHHFARELLESLGRAPQLDDDAATEMLVQCLLDGTILAVLQEDAPRLLDAPKSAWLSDLTSEPGGPEPKRLGHEQDHTTWFQVRVVDDLGHPLEGLALTLFVDGIDRRVTTDADGTARVDGATLSNATVTIGDITALRALVRPRWEQVREGEWITASPEHTIWRFDQGDEAPRPVITTPDPHGLACDGKWLYWLSYERNGKLELSTGTIGRLPPMGPRGQDRDLAVGDVLYGRSEHAVWRIEGPHVTPISPDGLDLGRRMAEIGAGKRMVVLPMIDRTARDSIAFYLLRLGVDGTMTKIPFVGLPGALRWSVSRAGNVVLLGEPGQVLRQDAKASKPRVLFEEPGVSAVCWCGDDVCTVDGDDVLRRHRRGAAEAEVVAEGTGGSPRNLACGPDRIAWSARKDKDRATEIHLVQAR